MQVPGLIPEPDPVPAPAAETCDPKCFQPLTANRRYLIHSALDSDLNSVLNTVLPMIFRLIASLCASACLAGDIPSSGLLVDLDASKGVTVDAQGRVTAWQSQAGPAAARDFVGQPKGRADATSGLPSVAAGSAPALSFRQQELVCHDEAAFDGLIRGDGCTWIAVLKVYPQRVGLKDVNSFFGNLRNGQKYEGLWGCLDDDNTIWWGARNGLTFGRFDVNNPKLVGPKLAEGRFHVLAGRLGAPGRAKSSRNSSSTISRPARRPAFRSTPWPTPRSSPSGRSATRSSIPARNPSTVKSPASSSGTARSPMRSSRPCLMV